MSLNLITQSQLEPIDLEVARMHLRLDAEGSPPTHPEDELITALVSAAREHAEEFTGLDILQRTWETRSATFPDAGAAIALARIPALAVVSVTYIDVYGFEQVMLPEDYIVDITKDGVGTVSPVAEDWPEARGEEEDDVVVEWVSGYAFDGDSPWIRAMPRTIRAAMLLFVGHLYANREAVNVGNAVNVFPLGVETLLRPHRVRLGMA